VVADPQSLTQQQQQFLSSGMKESQANKRSAAESSTLITLHELLSAECAHLCMHLGTLHVCSSSLQMVARHIKNS
jgi:hypothetical protein